jgi:hypothetical protein
MAPKVSHDHCTNELKVALKRRIRSMEKIPVTVRHLLRGVEESLGEGFALSQTFPTHQYSSDILLVLCPSKIDGTKDEGRKTKARRAYLRPSSFILRQSITIAWTDY